MFLKRKVFVSSKFSTDRHLFTTSVKSSSNVQVLTRLNETKTLLHGFFIQKTMSGA